MEDFEEYSLDSVVRGHHIYKAVWTPVVGEVLAVQAEEDNSEDQYAVAVLKAGGVVGHVPREYSRIFYYFLRHGGTIECAVSGHRKHGVGLEVPCMYTFHGRPKHIKKLIKLWNKPRKCDDKD